MRERERERDGKKQKQKKKKEKKKKTNLHYWKNNETQHNKKGFLLCFSSPTPFFLYPTENERFLPLFLYHRTQPYPNLPLLTCAPTSHNFIKPRVSFSLFSLSVKLGGPLRFRFWIGRRIRLKKVLEFELGLGFLRDVGCFRHWWICSLCAGGHSGSTTVRESIKSVWSEQPISSEEMDCFGTAISESTSREISPWPSSKPTSSSKTISRSSPVNSVPSSASTTVTVAPRPLATSAITCSIISKVRDFETLYRNSLF